MHDHTLDEARTAARLQPLVDAADVEGLLVAVDGLCAAREWDDLTDLARRCIVAVELGKQLWPVAMHIEYRLAWEAPAPYAGAVLRPGAARFALGPLTEVAASTHDWAALSPHIASPAAAGSVAQERVLRGEDLSAAKAMAELPLRLCEWEPVYALPVYRDRSAKFPEPEVAVRTLPAATPVRAGDLVVRDPAARGLADVVETWVSQSAGHVRAVAVIGGAREAVGALSEVGALLQVSAAEALALLQWAGASGGAYGRRRGGASGRFSAWWAAAALAGFDWPDAATPAELDAFAHDLGEAISELSWYRWGTGAPQAGWVLRLAVADPADGLAWAIDAVDRRDDDAAS